MDMKTRPETQFSAVMQEMRMMNPRWDSERLGVMTASM